MCDHCHLLSHGRPPLPTDNRWPCHTDGCTGTTIMSHHIFCDECLIRLLDADETPRFVSNRVPTGLAKVRSSNVTRAGQKGRMVGREQQRDGRES